MPRSSTFALLLAVLCSGCDGSDLSPCEELGRGAREAVLEVEVDGVHVCLATVVAPHRALTAKHCVQSAGEAAPVQAERVELRADGGERLQVLSISSLAGTYRHLGELAGSDLAVVHFGGTFDPEPLGVSEESVAQGDEVCVFRRAALESPAGTLARAVESSQIYTPGLTIPGDSGGPLVDASGEIVGVASWKSDDEFGPGLSAFTRTDVHRSWLVAALAGT